MAGQEGFWDVEDRLQELSAHGDPLDKLGETIDFEMFRADLVAALGERDPAKGGHPGFDPVLKFRMLVLQVMHGLTAGPGRISLARSAELDAVLRAWPRRQGAGRLRVADALRQHALGLPGGADQSDRLRGAV